MSDKKQQRRNRLYLVLLCLLFASPILAAFYLNSTWSDWAPSMTKNNGELIEPVVELPSRWTGEEGGLGLGDGHHWAVLVAGDRCADDCTALLSEMLAVHRALGHRGDRVRIALVSTEEGPVLEASTPLALAVDPALEPFLSERVSGEGAVFLVDPLGNLMMRYPRDFDATGLRKDLQRLLKYSKVGT